MLFPEVYPANRRVYLTTCREYTSIASCLVFDDLYIDTNLLAGRDLTLNLATFREYTSIASFLATDGPLLSAAHRLLAEPYLRYYYFHVEGRTVLLFLFSFHWFLTQIWLSHLSSACLHTDWGEKLTHKRWGYVKLKNTWSYLQLLEVTWFYLKYLATFSVSLNGW